MIKFEKEAAEESICFDFTCVISQKKKKLNKLFSVFPNLQL